MMGVQREGNTGLRTSDLLCPENPFTLYQHLETCFYLLRLRILDVKRIWTLWKFKLGYRGPICGLGLMASGREREQTRVRPDVSLWNWPQVSERPCSQAHAHKPMALSS